MWSFLFLQHCCFDQSLLFIKIAGFKELKFIFLYLNSSKQLTLYILNEPASITLTTFAWTLPAKAFFASLSKSCDIFSI